MKTDWADFFLSPNSMLRRLPIKKQNQDLDGNRAGYKASFLTHEFDYMHCASPLNFHRL
jgi:hypothetical protein